MTAAIQPPEKYLIEWVQLCSVFYTENNQMAGAVIGLVEFATRENGEVKINWNATDDKVFNDIEPLLAKIGFVNGIMLFPEEYETYIAKKREVRSEWHSKKAAELHQELDRLLHCKPAHYTPPHRRSELQTFLSQYKSSLGAQPFIKGLLCTLQLQINQLTLVSWTLLDDTFTQNGPDFMRATINLLVNVLGYTHTIQEADESGQQSSLRTWYLSSTLTDAEIISLIKVFPNYHLLGKVRATGTIDLSSQSRSLDMINKQKSIIGRLCWLPINVVLLWLWLFRSWISVCFGIFTVL